MDFENQKMIENMFNDRQTEKLVMSALVKNSELLMKMALLKQVVGDGINNAWEILVKMALAKRANVVTIVGMVGHSFRGPGDSYVFGYQQASGFLELMLHFGLIKYDESRDEIVVAYDITDKEAALINQYAYLPPMIVPPLKVEGNTNRGSGYLTIRDDSLLLQNNHHSQDICHRILNKLNGTAFRVDERVVKGIRNNWKSIDRPKPEESFENYKKRIKAFERYERDAFHTIALMIEMGNQFWFTHKYDKRGRVYCQG